MTSEGQHLQQRTRVGGRAGEAGSFSPALNSHRPLRLPAHEGLAGGPPSPAPLLLRTPESNGVAVPRTWACGTQTGRIPPRAGSEVRGRRGPVTALSALSSSGGRVSGCPEPVWPRGTWDAFSRLPRALQGSGGSLSSVRVPQAPSLGTGPGSHRAMTLEVASGPGPSVVVLSGGLL